MERVPPRAWALALVLAALAALAAAPSAAAQQQQVGVQAITCPANCLSCVRTRTIIKPQYQATRKLQTAPLRIQWCGACCMMVLHAEGGRAPIARALCRRRLGGLTKIWTAVHPPECLAAAAASVLPIPSNPLPPPPLHICWTPYTQHRLRHRLRAEQPGDPLRLRARLRRRQQEQPLRRVRRQRGRAPGPAGAQPVQGVRRAQGAERG